jgi:hypothetical protein
MANITRADLKVGQRVELKQGSYGFIAEILEIKEGTTCVIKCLQDKRWGAKIGHIFYGENIARSDYFLLPNQDAPK